MASHTCDGPPTELETFKVAEGTLADPNWDQIKAMYREDLYFD